MWIYFLLIRIAALFGHKKARAMVRGQRETLKRDLSGCQGCVWIHAASVGEFEQARPLIEKLKSKNEKLKIVVTFFSPSGYEAHKDYDQADAVLFLPFATRRNALKWLEAVQPQMAIFVPQQYFFHWWGKGQLRLLRCFTHLYVQDEASLRLLTEHGVHQASVAGDTRFDRMAEVRRERVNQLTNERLLPMALFAEGCERVIVAGSTWPKDEELLLHYLNQLNEETDLPVKLILVPHEIDAAHLHYIFNLFQGRYVSYSAVSGRIPKTSQQDILRRAEVLVVDTIGLLSSTYHYGQVAYIGGGFGEGIHNTVEAAAYGMPVLFGPNYHHFREAEGLIAAGAARSVKNGEELCTAMNEALNDHTTIGEKAAAYVENELGATEKIYNEIFK